VITKLRKLKYVNPATATETTAKAFSSANPADEVAAGAYSCPGAAH
jgi:hypothetical protein